MQSHKNKKIIIVSFVLATVLAAGIAFWLNRIFIFDLIASWSYHPTPEMATVEEKIALTGNGKIIFQAVNPSLENRDNFNNHCDSHNQEVSVLGCYVSGRIYIYNVKSKDLNGVVESTAAHELLHAVWHRLDAAEKKRLSALLTSVYNDSRYHDLLAEDLETYSELDRTDELHSRIGTEIANLPAELEQHYAKYFANQDLVVDFYDNYIQPFKELKEEMENLSAELEKLDVEIESKTNDYYHKAEELSSKIDEFNKCASTVGCFITDTAFYTARSALVAEQTAIEEFYNNINQLIIDYNQLVAEYNDNILRGEALEKTINSNSEIEKTIENK